jgi:soluble lytic murein transglycosylase-like protein
MHLKLAVVEVGLNLGQQATMVDRAQRMQAPVTDAHRRVGIPVAQSCQQPGQDVSRQIGHVAGDQQSAIRRTALSQRIVECGPQAAQRTAIRDQVGDVAMAQIAIRADNGDVAAALRHDVGNAFEQRTARERQQGFVASHAMAAPAGQDIAASVRTRTDHAKMVAVFRSVLLLTILLGAGTTAFGQNARKLVVRADARTGRLVTVAIPLVPRAHRTAPAEIAKIVAEMSATHQVDPLLVHSVIQVESNYNPNAVSLAGAQGLMQLMPETARDMGVADSFDPRQNIEGGVKYLKMLQSQYRDERLVLAAYNAGPAAVQKYGQIPPYPETREYVERVGARYVEAKRAAALAPTAAPQVAPQHESQATAVGSVVTTEEKHARLEQFYDEYGRLHLRTAPF